MGPLVPDCRPVDAVERNRVGTVHHPYVVFAYLSPIANRLQNERAWLLLLDPNYYLVTVGTIGQGDSTGVEIDLDWALACVRRGGQSPFAVLAHNHPNGHAWPSEDDASLTRSMARVAYGQGVELLDHIVIGRDQFYSFRQEQLWSVAPRA